MINLLIGFLSFVILLFLFSVIERKRVPQIGKTKYIFLVIVLFSSFLISPTENVGEWLIWLLFLYTVLDDLKTKTVFVPIYALIVFILFFQGKTIEEFALAALIFLIFLILSKKTKETFFCIGDTYAIFALAFWLGSNILLSILLSVFLVAAILPMVDKIVKRKVYPYTPYLAISTLVVKENWYIFELFAVSLVVNIIGLIIFFVLQRIRKRK